MGAAYDLFGNGKTAVKFNLGKYMEAITATNNDLDLNPLIRTTISTTRVWTDTNKDFVPNCDLVELREERRMRRPWTIKTLGKEVFNRTFDPGYVTGWGTRPYNWGLGLSVQQELMPRVSVNVGYFRNWWGNWYVVDNRATDVGRLHAVQHHGAGRSAAAGRRRPGHQRPVQPRPDKVGPVDELAQHVEQLRGADRELAGRGRQRHRAAAERAHGAGGHEHRAQARGRLRRARRLRAGTGPTGAKQRDTARRHRRRAPPGDEPVLPRRRAVHDAVPRARDVYDPQGRRPGERDVASIPGRRLAANFVANNAEIAAGPQPLGRNLSGAANVTVNLIQPETFFADRRNNIDFRVAKIIRYGRTRTQVGVRHLQPHEQRRGDRLQPDVLADEHDVADADGDSAGAVREVQRAVRLLAGSGLQALASRPGTYKAPEHGIKAAPASTARRSSGNHAAPHGVQHQFGGVVHVQLLQDVRAVGFDRGGTDGQQLGDLLVAVALRRSAGRFPARARTAIRSDRRCPLSARCRT